MVKFVGISGKPGSNKMTYAFPIVRELRVRGFKTDLVSLAKPLYDELNEIAQRVGAGVSDDELILKYELGERGDELLKLLGPDLIGESHPIYGYSRRNESFRRALSLLGSRIRRKQNENYYIDKLVNSLPSELDFAVLADLRFPNEADYIFRNEGMTIRVNVNEPENNSGGFKYEAGMSDVTETALDKYYLFDYEFYRNSFNGLIFGKELEKFFDLSKYEEVVR